MKFVSRSAWGARYGRGNRNITPSRGGVTIHYEGGGKLTGRPHSQCDNRVRGIERYHVEHNGWAGIAYTALVCEHGYVFEGRGLGHRTAANGTNSGNQNWYAVCALIGDRDPLSADLLAGLRDAIEWCRDGGAGRRVNGHRDHLATSCPGDRLYAWVRAGLPAEEDDMQLSDKVSVKDWIKRRWPKDRGLADGISVNTALVSGYAWGRIAAENTERLVPLVEAQGAAIREMAAALAARDEAVDVDALVARIAEQIERVTVRLDVEDAN